MLKNIITFILLVFIISFLSLECHAKIYSAHSNVSSDIDKLISCGVIEKTFYGQRPFTKKHLNELIKKHKTSHVCDQKFIDDLLVKIKKEIGFSRDQAGIKIKPVESVFISYQNIYNGNSFFVNNNRGTINANVNSFTEYSGHTLMGEGHNLNLSMTHYFSWYGQDLYIEPRFGLLLSQNFNNTDDVVLTMQQAYAHFNVFNASLVVGRAPVLWGQAEYGGFLFSENVRPLDVILLSHDDSFSLPWFFSKLGNFKASFIFGTLGPEQRYPWTLFSGLSLGYKPASFLEFNLSHVFEFGGDGAPDMSFKTGVQEFFGFIPFISQTSQSAANKITELNMRFFADSFMGLQGYVGYAMDDSNLTGGIQALKKHFTSNSSYLLGLYFTRPFGLINDLWRFEFTHMGQIAGRHSRYADGWTVNGFILGDPAGPDSYRFRTKWTHSWDKPGTKSSVVGVWTKRDSNSYTVASEGYPETVLNEGASEYRYQLFLEHRWLYKKIGLSTYAGMELINNYLYNQGDTEVSSRFGMALTHDI